MKQVRRKDRVMTSNHIKPGRRTVGVNIPHEMALDLEARAESMHLSKSSYCKLILQQWLDSERRLTVEEK